MSKPDTTPVAAIILIIVLGIALVGCLVGGLFFGAGLFFYQAQPIQAPAVQGPTIEPSLDVRPAEDIYQHHYQAASIAHATGDLQRALDEFTAAIEANPDAFAAYLTRGVVHQQLADWQAALDDFRIAKKLNPDDYGAYNNIAMLLAACPDDEIRNGAQAAEYAQKACELTEWNHPAVLNTLAIAYAELGDWQAATDICDAQLGQLEDGPMAEEFKLLRELFVQEMPYRLTATQ